MLDIYSITITERFFLVLKELYPNFNVNANKICHAAGRNGIGKFAFNIWILRLAPDLLPLEHYELWETKYPIDKQDDTP